MKKITIPILICYLLLASCSRAPYLVLFNNGILNIRVYYADKIEEISAKTSKEIIYPGVYRKMKIVADGRLYEYDVAYPPVEYCQFGVLRDRIYCQFDDDGSIYVVKPGYKFPRKMDDQQPPGFPLRPRREGVTH